jgi:hypothetical protein
MVGSMQLAEFKSQVRKPRWGLDSVICIAAAVCFPVLIEILTWPMDSPRRELSRVAITATIAYPLSAVIGKWVVRVPSKSFAWTALVGTAFYVIGRFTISLPTMIEFHDRFHGDTSLTAYLVQDFVSAFGFIVVFLGGFLLIATASVRIVFATFRSVGLYRSNTPDGE